jgi:translation initiation factor IF-3
MSMKKDNRAPAPRINDRITFDHLQLISETGENVGVISREDALLQAQRAGLDLVLLTDQGAEGHAVAKIMDHGKMLYEKKKQQVEAKKKQHIIQVKEVKLRPKIAEHDYQTKMKQAMKFLVAGKHVKITLMFRGRQIAMKHTLAKDLFERVNATFEASDELDMKSLVEGKDAKAGQFWSRTYHLKK